MCTIFDSLISDARDLKYNGTRNKGQAHVARDRSRIIGVGDGPDM